MDLDAFQRRQPSTIARSLQDDVDGCGRHGQKAEGWLLSHQRGHEKRALELVPPVWAIDQ